MARGCAPPAPMAPCSGCSLSRSSRTSHSRWSVTARQRRDFIYVSDVADAFLRAAETPLIGKIWNLGAGNPQSVNRLVELIGGPVTYIPKRPGEPDVTWADIGEITNDLGWRAACSV